MIPGPTPAASAATVGHVALSTRGRESQPAATGRRNAEVVGPLGFPC